MADDGARCTVSLSDQQRRDEHGESTAVSGTSPPRGVTVLYRGQLELERSRIEFILASLADEFDAIDFVHLSPGVGSGADDLREFVVGLAHIRTVSFVPAGARGLVAARRRVRELLASDARTVVAIGFSIWPIVVGMRCRAWFIHGIPEERLLTSSSLRDRLAVRASWWGANRVSADVHVVVSVAMSRLVDERLRPERILVVPNAVDRTTYREPSNLPRTWLTYQGGGSPWQGIDRLSEVWAAIHDLDPSVRFRVISRDPRTAVLTRGLPGDVVEHVSASDAEGVAALLGEARVGFLFRATNLVNTVAWPMKLGEYVSAGVPVVVTDCGWDIASFVVEHEAGLVVQWEDSPDTTARALLAYLDSIGLRPVEGTRHAADALAATRWRSVLGQALATDGRTES